jgi:hypothetical protein
MQTNIKLILLFTTLAFASSMSLFLDPYEKTCVYKDIQEKQTLSGVYYFSGQDEDQNEVTIVSPKNVLLFKKESLKNGSFNINTELNGQYAICFKLTSSTHMTVSFDFHDEAKNEQLISVSKKCANFLESIDNLNTVIHGMRKKLDIIHSNIRNSAVRRSTHLESKFRDYD